MNLYSDLPAAKGEVPSAPAAPSISPAKSVPAPPAVPQRTAFVPTTLAAKRKAAAHPATAPSGYFEGSSAKRPRTDSLDASSGPQSQNLLANNHSMSVTQNLSQNTLSNNHTVSISQTQSQSQSQGSTMQVEPVAHVPSDFSLAALHVFPTNIDDEYDPSKPNDYETVLSNREFEEGARRRAEELAEDMRAMQREREALVEDFDSAGGSSQNLTLKGRRGLDLMPAWMKAKMEENARVQQAQPDQDQAKPADTTSAAAVDTQTSSTHSSSAPHIAAPIAAQRGTALQMMEKWGYQEGKGLGRAEAGITAPLVHTQVGVGRGVVSLPGSHPSAHNATSQGAEHAPASHGTRGSRVVLIKNMVGAGEVDDYLDGDVKQECESKYGRVDSVIIYECSPEKHMPPEEAVRIFVSFTLPSAAEAAIAGLNGRFFAGRSITAEAFNEVRFREYDLAPP